MSSRRGAGVRWRRGCLRTALRDDRGADVPRLMQAKVAGRLVRLAGGEGRVVIAGREWNQVRRRGSLDARPHSAGRLDLDRARTVVRLLLLQALLEVAGGELHLLQADRGRADPPRPVHGRLQREEKEENELISGFTQSAEQRLHSCLFTDFVLERSDGTLEVPTKTNIRRRNGEIKSRTVNSGHRNGNHLEISNFVLLPTKSTPYYVS